MTLYHWICCMGLTYGPFYFMFRAGQSVYDANNANVRIVLNTASYYFITQLAKILVMATFLPSADPNSSFNSTIVLVSCVVNFIDFVGLYQTGARSLGNRLVFEKNVLLTGLGWSIAEAVTLNLIPLWIEARGMEFEWKFVFIGLQANINMFWAFGMIATVWLLRRTNLSKNLQVLLTFNVVIYVLWSSFAKFLEEVYGIELGYILLLKAAIAVYLIGNSYASKAIYSHQLSKKAN
eukprot:TRINITY_DN2923_c0_g1_i1.p1 TRINITY_DN2923_c0_g1~~TRINITY_DN2923_c0_g1_i1.p1  ORF type:complete len:236 (-),score=65.89 TRINITY_DN2923_c0_g1_i1:34-741(-)